MSQLSFVIFPLCRTLHVLNFRFFFVMLRLPVDLLECSPVLVHLANIRSLWFLTCGFSLWISTEGTPDPVLYRARLLSCFFMVSLHVCKITIGIAIRPFIGNVDEYLNTYLQHSVATAANIRDRTPWFQFSVATTICYIYSVGSAFLWSCTTR